MKALKNLYLLICSIYIYLTFARFYYFPSVWMPHSSKPNSKINSLHERTIRIVYQDQKSSFKELIQRDKSVTTHKSGPQ